MTSVTHLLSSGRLKYSTDRRFQQITYMLSTLMAVVTIDRWGRRVGLYWGAIGQGISMILAGAFARLLKDHPEKASQYGGAAAFFVFAYTAIFGATWLTIPWVRRSVLLR